MIASVVGEDDPVRAREILQAMGRIEPDDQIGANVLRDLLDGAEEEKEDG